MFVFYLVVTLAVAALNIYAAAMDFTGARSVLATMESLGIPRSALPLLAVLKAAGALGLLAGIVVPALGVAAATGLALYFVFAVATVLKKRLYPHLPYPATFLAAAVAALVVRLVAW